MLKIIVMLKTFLYFFCILGIFEILGDLYIFHKEYTAIQQWITTLLFTAMGALVLTCLHKEKADRQKQKMNRN